MKKEPKRWRVIDFVTPLGAIRRASSSIAHTASMLKESAQKMHEQLPGQQAKKDYESDDPRGIRDSAERFEALYVAGDWTEFEIARQIIACHRTKITAICMIIFSLAAIVILATSVPKWMAIFLIPVSGSLFILGLAMTFKYALMETQLLLRDLIAANEFVARDDFWRRLIG